MTKFVALLIQPLSVISMSFAWLFCLGCLLDLGASFGGHTIFFLANGVEAGVLFGAQAGCVVLLEFDHWRSYYGVGALWRELFALALAGVTAWVLVRLWPSFAGDLAPLEALRFWILLLLIVAVPYLASQCSYLLLGE